MTEAKKALKVTPAASWKKAQEEIVELPSGNVVKLIRHNMYVMRKTGQVPDFARQVMDDADNATGDQKQDTVEWRVALAFVEPKVVTGKPKEGELSIDDIEDRDKAMVVSFLGASLGF